MVLFEEKQKFNQIWLWGILIGAGILLAVTVWPDVARGRLGPHLFGIVLYLLVLCATAVVTLRTRIYPDRLEVALQPFSSRTIYKHEIARAYVRSYSPTGEYGGWGYRRGSSGTAYNMSGDQGLQLELENGKKVLIGTQVPEALQRAIAGWVTTD